MAGKRRLHATTLTCGYKVVACSVTATCSIKMRCFDLLVMISTLGLDYYNGGEVNIWCDAVPGAVYEGVYMLGGL